MAQAKKKAPGTARFQFDFMRWRIPFLVFSVVALIGTGALFAFKGLNYGIDFAGGVVLEIQTAEAVPMEKLRSILDARYHEVSLQAFGQNEVMIRLPNPKDGNSQQLVNDIKTYLGESLETHVDFRRAEYVGPQVGDELKLSGVYALLLSFAAMLVYIWFRFEWQFGVGGVLALVHDITMTAAFFLITGAEFDLTSIAAILTIVGYSINDTVVIYDRIRENMRRYKKMSLVDLLNLSLNETLSRTFLTAGTTLLTLLALLIFGGPMLFNFSLAVFIGVLVGTYSSIFIAAPVLVYFGLPREDEARPAPYMAEQA